MSELDQKRRLPLKSVAGALLFTVFLGFLGLLYATALGGIIMILVGFVIISSKLWVPILLFWIMCCVISVLAVNRYNNKLICN